MKEKKKGLMIMVQVLITIFLVYIVFEVSVSTNPPKQLAPTDFNQSIDLAKESIL